MARQSIEIPDEFRELAKQYERSVNWLAQQAFSEYVFHHPVRASETVSERKPNASSNRPRQR
jgi:hypothetical protein